MSCHFVLSSYAKTFRCAAISRNKSLCRSISSKTLVFIISYSFAFALRIKCHKLEYFQKWFYIGLSSIPSPSIPLHVCRCSQKLIVWQNVHHVTLPRTHDNPIDEMRRMDYSMKYAMRNWIPVFDHRIKRAYGTQCGWNEIKAAFRCIHFNWMDWRREGDSEKFGQMIHQPSCWTSVPFHHLCKWTSGILYRFAYIFPCVGVCMPLIKYHRFIADDCVLMKCANIRCKLCYGICSNLIKHHI